MVWRSLNILFVMILVNTLYYYDIYLFIYFWIFQYIPYYYLNSHIEILNHALYLLYEYDWVHVWYCVLLDGHLGLFESKF
jgi:hypothetical protein